MASLPEIKGYCNAGCAWRVPHYSEFVEGMSFIKIGADVDGRYTGDVPAAYRIDSSVLAQGKSALASLPIAVRGATAAAVGKDIFIFYGHIDGGTNGAIYKYDTVKETLEQVGTAPAANASFFATAAAVGKKIYVFGGELITYTASNGIFVFDTDTNEATALTCALPANIEKMSAATVGKYIYLFGGQTSSGYSSAIYRFDAETEEITTLTATLPTAAYGIGAAAVGENVYLFGGYSANGALDTILKFSASGETVEALSVTILPANYDMYTAVIGNRIYLIAGSETNTVFYFDTDNNDLRLTASMPNSNGGACASVGNTVYIFGCGTATWNAGVMRFNPQTYRFIAGISYTDANGTNEHILSFTECDVYRNAAKFEIVYAAVNEAADEITLVYEINGARYIKTLYGSEIDAESLKFIAYSADRVARVNDGTYSAGTTAVVEVEEIVEEVIAALPRYNGEVEDVS